MSQFHFDPATYAAFVREEIPRYDELQEMLAEATASVPAGSILDLGTGTGETLAHVLARHPAARVVGVDENDGMLARARRRLAAYDVRLQVADLSDELPAGPFDLVVSALAVHHLDGPGKAALFGRVAAALRPGGRFVLADVVVPEGPGPAVIDLSDGYDKPSTVAEQLGWLEQAGLDAAVAWQEDDLALMTADRPGAGH
jgi:tRNA (cmo5U34)-methyltransferase